MAAASAMLRLKSAAISCFVLFLFSPHVCAKWVKSSLDSHDTMKEWEFITRFCFLSENGKFDFVFKYPKKYGVQQLLLYYDAPGQWESVYKSDKNCTERLQVLSKANNQIIDLTNQITDSRPAGCSVYMQNGEEFYNCTDRVEFRASRERWWYIAVARCGQSVEQLRGLVLDYELHLMNGNEDDFLHYELSADEFYILPTDIAFLLIYFILIIFSIICAVILYNNQMLHTTYKMYMTALCLWFFGLFLQCIAWGRYSETGREEGPTEVTGRIFEAASTTVFLLMLILLAKGFTITRGRLTQMSTVRLSVFFCLYIIINITLFIWEGVVFDEGWVLYFYESEPGYGLIGLRLCGWLWFTYAFAFTMKHHSNKAKFYIPFYIFYTVWFWAGPVVILVAIFSIAKWSREKTVNGVEHFIALCGHLFFLVLTRPSAANSNFPFHLRVSQVRFSDEEEPEQRYQISEESRQHLDSMFVVSGRQAPPSYPMSNCGQGNASNGYVNGGYAGTAQNGHMTSHNGYNPRLDETFTTERNGQLPSSASPSALLPPLYGTHIPGMPPAYQELTSSSSHSERQMQSPRSKGASVVPRLPPLSHDDGGDGSQLPPSSGSSEPSPPLMTSAGDGSQLPPLSGSSKKLQSPRLTTSAGDGSQLPPLHSGALPPISKVSAPHEDDDDDDSGESDGNDNGAK